MAHEDDDLVVIPVRRKSKGKHDRIRKSNDQELEREGKRHDTTATTR